MFGTGEEKNKTEEELVIVNDLFLIKKNHPQANFKAKGYAVSDIQIYEKICKKIISAMALKSIERMS